MPQLDDLKDSLAALKYADMNWILLAILIYFAGIFTLATQVFLLSLKKLSYVLTYKVEVAAQFVSKLMPSFLGTFSLNMYYLIKKGHTTNQAATVMAANSAASGVAYTLLIILALTKSSVTIPDQHQAIEISSNLVIFVVILVIGLLYVFLRSVNLRKRIKQEWSELKQNFKAYRGKSFNLILTVILNALGSAANVFAIFASAKAIGIDITFADSLLVYTFGNIATTLIPTPGGIGAAEAGIYSGLILVGVSGPDAITITLLYRLISYWLPIIPGYFAFWGLRNNILSDFSFKKRYAS